MTILDYALHLTYPDEPPSSSHPHQGARYVREVTLDSLDQPLHQINTSEWPHLCHVEQKNHQAELFPNFQLTKPVVYNEMVIVLTH